MSQTQTEPEIRKGLVGVVADTTAISKVNPDSNSLLYRGYPVQELAARCTFEEVAYLLWHGELPTPEQLADLEEAGRTQRALAPEVRAAIDLVPTSAHPMDVLRTAVSVIGATDPTAEDASPAANYAKSVRLLAQIPAVVGRASITCLTTGSSGRPARSRAVRSASSPEDGSSPCHRR